MPRVPDSDVHAAAVEVMVRHGYAGATTKEIAEEAGINEVTLFRRFGTKANLLRGAMLAELEAFGGPEGLSPTGDVLADLVRVVESYQALLHRRGRLLPTLLAELPRHEELAEVADVPRRLIGAISELLAAYQREGVLVEEPPFRTAASLLAPLFVFAVLGPFAPPVAEPFDARAHVEAFLQGRRVR